MTLFILHATLGAVIMALIVAPHMERSDSVWRRGYNARVEDEKAEKAAQILTFRRNDNAA